MVLVSCFAISARNGEARKRGGEGIEVEKKNGLLHWHSSCLDFKSGVEKLYI